MNGALSLFLDVGAPGVGGWDPDLSTTCLLWQEKKRARGKKIKESCPLLQNRIPACRVNFSDVLAFLFLAPALRPHLAVVKNDVMQFFILHLTPLWKATCLIDSKLLKGQSTRNKDLLEGAQEKLYNWAPHTQKNRTVNCYPFCCY